MAQSSVEGGRLVYPTPHPADAADDLGTLGQRRVRPGGIVASHDARAGFAPGGALHHQALVGAEQHDVRRLPLPARSIDQDRTAVRQGRRHGLPLAADNNAILAAEAALLQPPAPQPDPALELIAQLGVALAGGTLKLDYGRRPRALFRRLPVHVPARYEGGLWGGNRVMRTGPNGRPDRTLAGARRTRRE